MVTQFNPVVFFSTYYLINFLLIMMLIYILGVAGI